MMYIIVLTFIHPSGLYLLCQTSANTLHDKHDFLLVYVTTLDKSVVKYTSAYFILNKTCSMCLQVNAIRPLDEVSRPDMICLLILHKATIYIKASSMTWCVLWCFILPWFYSHDLTANRVKLYLTKSHMSVRVCTCVKFSMASGQYIVLLLVAIS